MSGFPPNSKSAFDKAAASNMVVRLPEPNQLQIDIDDAGAYQVFQKHLCTLQSHWVVIGVEEHPSKSRGDKKHITVTLKEPVKSDTERILLQAVLGSDGLRELLSYVQVLTLDPHPILFLETLETVQTLGIEPFVL